jgi:hypothetical protein
MLLHIWAQEACPAGAAHGTESALGAHSARQRVLDVRSLRVGMASVPDAAWSLMANRRHKIYTGGRKTTYDIQPTCRYTRTSKGTAVAESSPEQNSTRWWRSTSRKGTTARGVGDGVLLLHKQKEDIRN